SCVTGGTTPRRWRRQHSPGAGTALLAENEVRDPAPADVRPAAAAVVEDVRAVAATVLQRVGHNRHRTEVARLVHLPRQDRGGVSPPRGVEGDGSEWVGNDVVEEPQVQRLQ